MDKNFRQFEAIRDTMKRDQIYELERMGDFVSELFDYIDELQDTISEQKERIDELEEQVADLNAKTGE